MAGGINHQVVGLVPDHVLGNDSATEGRFTKNADTGKAWSSAIFGVSSIARNPVPRITLSVGSGKGRGRAWRHRADRCR
jgi:hypothetical protein